jgi:hypothetical protein
MSSEISGGAAASAGVGQLSPEDEHDLVAALARDVVASAAPEELPLFRRTSEAYFADPSGIVSKAESKDEALGFGVEQAVILVTPAALAVATSVVQFLSNEVGGALKEEVGPRIKDLVEGLFQRADASPDGDKAEKAEKAEKPEPPPLTKEQLDEVYRVANTVARRLLPADRASTLADAVVGRLAR